MKIKYLLLLAAFCAICPAANAADASMLATPDHSLAVKDYVDKGVPSPDKAWLPADYQTAATALQTITQNDPTLLPRLDSPTSGALFKRFINEDNLSIFLDQSVAADKRMQRVAEIGSYTPLFMLYVHCSTPAHNYDAEIVELGAYLLHVEMDSAVVIKQFRVAHPELATNKQVQDALDMAKGGFAQTLGGIIDMMLDLAKHHPPEALRLANHLKTILPAILPEITADNQSQTVKKLKAAASAETSPDIKAALTDLASISAAAVK